MDEQGAEAAVAEAERNVREYPNCGKLLNMMASMVLGMLNMSGAWSTDKGKYKEKIYSWFERVTKCSGDEQVKNFAAHMLASEYIQEKEYGKAEKMIDSLPKQQADKRMLSARLLLAQEKYAEAAELLERKLIDVLNDLGVVLSMLMETALKENDTDRAEKIASAGEQTALLYDQWGIQFPDPADGAGAAEKGCGKEYRIHPRNVPDADRTAAYVGVCVLLSYIWKRKVCKKV